MNGKETTIKSAEQEQAIYLVPKLRFPEFRDSQSWTSRRIGEEIELEYGSPLAEIDRKRGPFPVVGSNGVVGFHDRAIVQGPAIVIGRKGSAGKLSWIESDCYPIDTTFFVVLKEPTSTSLAFIHFLLENESLEDLKDDGAVPGINRNVVYSQITALPQEAEQKKIAACLMSADELIASEARKLDALQAHKTGLMQQLFPTQGETIPRLRFHEFRDADEWEPKQISDLGKIITGSTPSTTAPEFYGGERFFVSPADISDERFIERTNTTLTDRGFEQTRPVPPNSVLFVCIGSTIGKVAQNLIECATNQQINAVIPDADYSGGFIYYMLSLVAPQIAALAGRHAVPIINKTAFGNVEVVLPKLAEQERIAQCLSSLDEGIAFQSRQIAALKTHKTGLMQQLFPIMKIDEEG